MIRLWRILIWLVPSSAVVILGALLVLLLSVFSGPHAPNDVAAIGYVLIAGTQASLLLVVVLGLAAALLARAGRTWVPVALLAVIAAIDVTPAFFPGIYDSSTQLLLAIPGALAYALALLRAPQLRALDRVPALLVGGLLLMPPAGAVGARVQAAAAHASSCPGGPAIDLTLSGSIAGHFTRACGLPRAGRGPNGCDIIGVYTTVPADRGFITLEVPLARGRLGTVNSPGAAPTLVTQRTEYFGLSPSRWSGTYTVDGDCTGTIDADLFNASGSAVHVRGRFATPPGRN